MCVVVLHETHGLCDCMVMHSPVFPTLSVIGLASGLRLLDGVMLYGRQYG